MFRRGPLPQHWHSIDTLNAGPVAPQLSPSSTSSNAGVCYYVPLMVRDSVTVKKLWVACSTSGTSLEIGLYDVGGTRLVSSGTQTHPASSTEFVYDCTDTPIGPGIYYFAYMALGGAATAYMLDVADVSAWAFGVWVESSLSNLPATATFATSAFANVPIGGILTNTVVS